MRIAVVGATGALGQELVTALAEEAGAAEWGGLEPPVLLATKESAGETFPWVEDEELEVEAFSAEAVRGLDLAVLATPAADWLFAGWNGALAGSENPAQGASPKLRGENGCNGCATRIFSLALGCFGCEASVLAGSRANPLPQAAVRSTASSTSLSSTDGGSTALSRGSRPT